MTSATDEETIKSIAAGDEKITAIALNVIRKQFDLRGQTVQNAVCLRAIELLIKAAESKT